ncbi:MAG TPA: Dabb family protein [Acidimicrobiia bacterium]
MIRVSGFVHLEPDALDEVTAALRVAAAELDDLLAFQVSPTKAVAHRAGQLMVLAAFTDRDATERARSHPAVTGVLEPLLDERASHVEIVRYEQGPADLRQPDLTRGIQRTLLFHIDPGVERASVATFERDLRSMPQYIDAIRNSSLSTLGDTWGGTGKPWTHVWEQEFATLEGLTGPYMHHGYHWSWIDTWFDPQAPNHIVDTTLVHAMCDLDRSILALR